MHCLYCGARLPLLRDLERGDYCSDSHRESWERLQHECEEAHTGASPGKIKPIAGPAMRIRMYPLRRACAAQPGPRTMTEGSGPLWRIEVRSIRFRCGVIPPPDMIAGARSAGGRTPGLRFWRSGEPFLRTLAIVGPLLIFAFLVLRFGAAGAVSASSRDDRNAGTWDRQWSDLRQTVLSRAAIDLTDDFRGGLDDWVTARKSPAWRYDSDGFVMPAGLALYRPTLNLSDYRLEFLAHLEKRGMGFVVRAADSGNYQAVRIIVTKPGPLPLADIEHFAVIGGKQLSRVVRPLPMTLRTDRMYRARIDVEGDDFTLIIQGEVVDFWTDGRLKRGGIGFFCDKGELARLRWVDVSHHYDMLGRLCAWLAPYGLTGAGGSWNQ